MPSRSTRLTPGDGHVEQGVDEVVGEQVDLVDVEHAAVRRGEQAGAERAARPSVSSSARSSEPITRSSVAPSGSSTNGRVAGQQGGEPAGQRRLGRSLVAAQQHAAEPRLDGGEQEGELGVVLADDGREARQPSVTATPPSPRPRAPRAAGLATASLARPPTCRARPPRAGVSAIDVSAHGFDALEELPHVGIGHVGGGHLLVHPVVDDVGGGVVAEQVVDGGGHLERALVAVALHRLDPARVDHPGAHDPGGLLGQRPHDRPGGVGGVAEPRLGVAPGERADGGDHAAVLLQVVVAVEDVVLAVVLVLDGDVDGGEAAAHGVLVGDAVAAPAVDVAGPGDVDRGEVVVGAPRSLLDARQDPDAVGARARAVDTRGRRCRWPARSCRSAASSSARPRARPRRRPGAPGAGRRRGRSRRCAA